MNNRDSLIEQVASAWRPSSPDGAIRPPAAWHDLDDAGRREAFTETTRQRTIEAALDPAALSTTAKAVLMRIRRT